MAIFNCCSTLVLISFNRKKFLPLFLFLCFCSCAGEKSKSSDDKEISSPEINAETQLEKVGVFDEGAKIFSENCKVCHGADGKKQLAGAKDLSVSTFSLEQRILQVSEGKTTKKTVMPPYKGILTPQQIKKVAEYIESLKK